MFDCFYLVYVTAHSFSEVAKAVSMIFTHFLAATKQLYERSCPSVRLYVHPLCPSHFF